MMTPTAKDPDGIVRPKGIGMAFLCHSIYGSLLERQPKIVDPDWLTLHQTLSQPYSQLATCPTPAVHDSSTMMPVIVPANCPSKAPAFVHKRRLKGDLKKKIRKNSVSHAPPSVALNF